MLLVKVDLMSKIKKIKDDIFVRDLEGKEEMERGVE